MQREVRQTVAADRITGDPEWTYVLSPKNGLNEERRGCRRLSCCLWLMRPAAYLIENQDTLHGVNKTWMAPNRRGEQAGWRCTE